MFFTNDPVYGHDRWIISVGSWPGSRKIGELYQEVDGYWYFWLEHFHTPVGCSLCLSESCLRQIVDKLRELNRDWDRVLDQMEKKEKAAQKKKGARKR